MQLKIKNININNERNLHEVVAIAGFSGSIKYDSMTEAHIELGSKEYLASIGIEWRKVESMMSEMLFAGFELKII